MEDITCYHGSPCSTIKYLRENSYVSIFPHVATIMSYYYSKKHPRYLYSSNNKRLKKKEMEKYYPDGRVWKDYDLKKPYDFGTKIYFKKDHIPDKIGTLYYCKVKPDDIKFLNPFEYLIKKKQKVYKTKMTKDLYNHSKKLYEAYIKHYILLQK